MIRVVKPTEPPAVLTTRGEPLRNELCAQMAQLEPPRLCFDRQVFGAPEVWSALRRAQHGKCCFCEAKLDHCSFSEVEHFRPARSVRQSRERRAYPRGYYWLAYDWSNLYLACTQCNRRHKRDLFPLEDDERRVRSHTDHWRLVEERPMLIDPGLEEPRAHIRFRRAYAAAVSVRGYETITALGLNRPALREERQRQREILIGLLTCVGLHLRRDEPEAAEPTEKLVRALELVGELTSDAGPFAAMCRATVSEMIPWRVLPTPLNAERTLALLRQDYAGGHRIRTPRQ